MDVDEFMAFLQTRPTGEHWDLIEGVAVMMAPPSPAHQRIARNLSELLNSAVAASPLDLFAYLGLACERRASGTFNPNRVWSSCPAWPATIRIPSNSGWPPRSCHRPTHAPKSI
jgi:hypothetical protein